MAALNFPDPNLQTSYTNPDTGIAYEWANGLWKAVRTAQTAPELFVDADGDNLTGNLTLGTDKILLDATTGAAEFAGNVTTQGYLNVVRSTTTNSFILANLSNNSNTAGNGKFIFFGDELLIGDDVNPFSGGSGFNTKISTDGSATFANYITSGVGDPGIPNIGYININGPSGQIYISKSTSAAVQIFDSNNNRNAILLNGDGSATFAGPITLGTWANTSDSAIYMANQADSGQITVKGNGSSSQSAFSVYSGGWSGSSNQVAAIKADGSATFASGTSNAAGVEISKNNSNASYAPLYLKQANTSGNLITGRDDFNGVNTFTVSATGSATFAGSIVSGNSHNSGLEGSEFYPTGQANNYRAIGVDQAFWTWYSDIGGTKTEKIAFRTTGSATFAGGVTGDWFVAYRNTTEANLLQAAFGYNNTLTTLVKGNGIFLGTSLGDANGAVPTGSNLRLLTDGSATFAGTINGTTVGTSDIKFKENIEAAPAQLADIEAFELKTFDWKDEAPISDELKAKRKLGLIAQEVEAICPEMVCEVAGQDDDSYKAINHDVLIMKLLGAVKELSDKNTALVERVAALESN